jgi:hypothetical protein
MIATVLVTVFTHDLAQGVLTGRAAVGLLLRAQGRPDALCRLHGPTTTAARAPTPRLRPGVLCVSADRFVAPSTTKEVIDQVRIDVSRAHFWDITAISALDKVVMKFRREGTEVEVIGLNEASATMVDRFAVHDKPGRRTDLMGHWSLRAPQTMPTKQPRSWPASISRITPTTSPMPRPGPRGAWMRRWSSCTSSTARRERRRAARTTAAPSASTPRRSCSTSSERTSAQPARRASRGGVPQPPARARHRRGVPEVDMRQRYGELEETLVEQEAACS